MPPQNEPAFAPDRRQLDGELHTCRKSQLLRLISVMGWSRDVGNNDDDDRLITLVLARADTPLLRSEVHHVFVQVAHNPS